MKTKTSLASAPAIILLAMALNAPAAEPSLDAVLTKHIEGMGGKAALEKVSATRMKVKIEGELFGAADGEFFGKAPNKFATRIEIPGSGEIREGFDGTIAWAKNPWEGLRVKSGEELAKAKRDSEFYRDLHMKSLYPNLVLKGTEKIGTEDAYVLEAKPTSTSKEKFWYSTKSGLMLRQDSEFEGTQGTIKVSSLPQDYQTVEGVKYPSTTKLKVMAGDQAFEMTIRLIEIKPNAPIQDAIFAKPAQ
jgi:hypothetical protein